MSNLCSVSRYLTKERIQTKILITTASALFALSALRWPRVSRNDCRAFSELDKWQTSPWNGQADERIITIDDVTEGKKASRWLRVNAVSL